MTKKIFSAIICLLFLSSDIPLFAQSDKASKKKSLIYTSSKTFIFQADYDSIGITTRNYIAMRVLDKEQYGGRVIAYHYFDILPTSENIDSLICSYGKVHVETTQVLDEGNYFWLHPPRSNYAPSFSNNISPPTYYDGLTQYFPFPEITLPFKIGKKSKNSYLSIKDPVCDCNLWMRYKITNKDIVLYRYKTRLVEAYSVSGVSKSKIGNYSFDYFFNVELGFVYWKYNCDNIVLLELNLIEVL